MRTKWPSKKLVGAKAACTLRIFVYDWSPLLTDGRGRADRMVEWGSPYFGETAGDAAGGMRSCLAEGASCQYTSFEDQRGTRQYTGELLVFQRLVRECRLVRNPALADYFLLPAFYGTCIAARWSSSP